MFEWYLLLLWTFVTVLPRKRCLDGLHLGCCFITSKNVQSVKSSSTVIPKNFAPLGDYWNFLLEQKPTIYNDGTGESGDDDVAGNIIFFQIVN